MQRQEVEHNSPFYQFLKLETEEHYKALKKRAEDHPEKLVFHLNERSIHFFKIAQLRQGFAGLIDLETGEIDLVPAYNLDDHLPRQDFYYEREDGKRINYRVESDAALGGNTGVIHTGALVLTRKSGRNGLMLGFGIFKLSDNEDQSQLQVDQNKLILYVKNRSIQNTKTLAYNEEYLIWAYKPYEDIDANPIYDIGRSIAGDLTNELIRALMHDLSQAIPDKALKLKTQIRTFDYEEGFLKASKEQKLSRIRENLAASLNNNNLAVTKRILTWLYHQEDYKYADETSKLTNLIAAIVVDKEQNMLPTLIESINDFNQTDQNGYSLMMWAVATNQPAIVRLLQEKGATPLDEAGESKARRLKTIIKFDMKKVQTILFDAVRNHDMDTIKFLADKGVNFNDYISSNKDSALHVASSLGYTDVVAALLENGANIHSMNGYYFTPLHVAATAGNHETVALLLSKGAKVNVHTKYSQAPLAYAAASDSDRSETLKLLLDDPHIDTNITISDASLPFNTLILKTGGYTPIMLAICGGSSPNVKTLLEHHKTRGNLSYEDLLKFAISNKADLSIMRVLIRGALEEYIAKAKQSLSDLEKEESKPSWGLTSLLHSTYSFFNSYDKYQLKAAETLFDVLFNEANTTLLEFKDENPKDKGACIKALNSGQLGSLFKKSQSILQDKKNEKMLDKENEKGI